jgi:RNA polymerase primary sigma factor
MRKKDMLKYTDLSDAEIAKRYQDLNDNLALEYLFYKYEKYIHKVASSYYWRTNLENDDILAEAKIGFMQGVQKYNAEGYFMYFTGLWMKVRMYVAIDNNSRLIRIPVNKLKDMRKIDAIIMNSPYEYFTIEEVAKQTGIEAVKVEKYLFTENKIFDINAAYSLAAGTSEEIFKKFNASDLQHDIKLLIEKLSKVEQYVLIHLFGLFGETKMDKITISENLNISTERVRQINDKIIRKFRHASFSSVLIQHLN